MDRIEHSHPIKGPSSSPIEIKPNYYQAIVVNTIAQGAASPTHRKFDRHATDLTSPTLWERVVAFIHSLLEPLVEAEVKRLQADLTSLDKGHLYRFSLDQDRSLGDQLLAFLFADQLQELIRDRLQAELGTLHRPTIVVESGSPRQISHHFLHMRLARTGWRGLQADRVEGAGVTTIDRNNPDVANLRVMRGPEGQIIAGACGVMETHQKALEGLLPLVIDQLERGGGRIENGVRIVPVVVQSLLSPAAKLSEKERRLLKQEEEAMKAIGEAGPIDFAVDGKEYARVQIRPILLNTQANIWTDWRHFTPSRINGDSASDKTSLPGYLNLIHEVAAHLRESIPQRPLGDSQEITESDQRHMVGEIERYLRQLVNRCDHGWTIPYMDAEQIRNEYAAIYSHLDALRSIYERIEGNEARSGLTLLDTLAQLFQGKGDAPGRRLEPAHELRLVGRLTSALDIPKLAHCYSGIDRTGTALALWSVDHAMGLTQIEAYTDEQKWELVRHLQVAIAVTLMSTGYAGLKYHTGIAQNPLILNYLPDEYVERSDGVAIRLSPQGERLLLGLSSHRPT